jgi:hypothetical protein
MSKKPFPPKKVDRKRLTRQGPLVSTLNEVVEMVGRGEWFYWGTAPKHPAIIWSMTVMSVAFSIRRRSLFRALDVRTGEAYVSKREAFDELPF